MKKQRLVSYHHRSVNGVMVSIAAYQAVDPGSIPGWRRDIFSNNVCNIVNFVREEWRQQTVVIVNYQIFWVIFLIF